MKLFKIGDVCTFLSGDPNDRTVVIESITHQDDKHGFATYIVRDLETGEREETASENLTQELDLTYSK